MKRSPSRDDWGVATAGSATRNGRMWARTSVEGQHPSDQLSARTSVRPWALPRNSSTPDAGSQSAPGPRSSLRREGPERRRTERALPFSRWRGPDSRHRAVDAAEASGRTTGIRPGERRAAAVRSIASAVSGAPRRRTMGSRMSRQGAASTPRCVMLGPAGCSGRLRTIARVVGLGRGVGGVCPRRFGPVGWQATVARGSVCRGGVGRSKGLQRWQ
jgi:hypothetical protein